MANKVSIIIPFFNAQDFLERSIMSVLNQTHDSIELILVNNLSTDLSSKIATKFLESKKHGVHLIDATANQSHTYSINVGIEKSTGDFIYTLDADDYIEPDYIEILLNGFRLYPKALISVSSYTKEYQFKDKYEITNRVYNYSYLDSFNNILRSYSKGEIPVMLWSKLYRKDVFKDYKLNESFYTSDVPNTYLILSNNPMVVFNSSRKYHYFIRVNSMSEKNLKDFSILEQDISIIVDQMIYFNTLGTRTYNIIKNQLFNVMVINLIYIKKLCIDFNQNERFDEFIRAQSNRLHHLKKDKLKWIVQYSAKFNNQRLIRILYYLIVEFTLKRVKRRSK